jgi:hypothetical protein
LRADFSQPPASLAVRWALISVERITGRREEFWVGTPVGGGRAIDQQAHGRLRDDANEHPPNESSRLLVFL